MFIFALQTLFIITWVLGLVLALCKFSLYLKSQTLKLKFAEVAAQAALTKSSFLAAMSGSNPPTEIPDHLKSLIEASPDHPEVNEIDPTDQISGVLFQSDSYPPDMDD